MSKRKKVSEPPVAGNEADIMDVDTDIARNGAQAYSVRFVPSPHPGSFSFYHALSIADNKGYDELGNYRLDVLDEVCKKLFGCPYAAVRPKIAEEPPSLKYLDVKFEAELRQPPVELYLALAPRASPISSDALEMYKTICDVILKKHYPILDPNTTSNPQILETLYYDKSRQEFVLPLPPPKLSSHIGSHSMPGAPDDAATQGPALNHRPTAAQQQEIYDCVKKATNLATEQIPSLKTKTLSVLRKELELIEQLASDYNNLTCDVQKLANDGSKKSQVGIAVFGRPKTGKTSIINYLMHHPSIKLFSGSSHSDARQDEGHGITMIPLVVKSGDSLQLTQQLVSPEQFTRRLKLASRPASQVMIKARTWKSKEDIANVLRAREFVDHCATLYLELQVDSKLLRSMDCYLIDLPGFPDKHFQPLRKQIIEDVANARQLSVDILILNCITDEQQVDTTVIREAYNCGILLSHADDSKLAPMVVPTWFSHEGLKPDTGIEPYKLERSVQLFRRGLNEVLQFAVTNDKRLDLHEVSEEKMNEAQPFAPVSLTDAQVESLQEISASARPFMFSEEIANMLQRGERSDVPGKYRHLDYVDWVGYMVSERQAKIANHLLSRSASKCCTMLSQLQSHNKYKTTEDPTLQPVIKEFLRNPTSQDKLNNKRKNELDRLSSASTSSLILKRVRSMLSLEDLDIPSGTPPRVYEFAVGSIDRWVQSAFDRVHKIMENEYQSYLQRKRKAPTTGFLTAAANLAKKLKNAPLAPVLRNQIKSDLVNVPWKSEVEKWIEQHNIQDVTRFCIVGSKKSAKLPEEFPAAISEYLKNAIGVLEEFDFAEFIRSLGSSSTQELKNLIKSLRSKLSTSPVVTRTKSDKLPEPSLFSRPNSLELPNSSNYTSLAQCGPKMIQSTDPYIKAERNNLIAVDGAVSNVPFREIDLNRETTDLYKREFVHLKINRELNEIEGEFSSLRKIQGWIKDAVDMAQTSDDNTRGFKGIFPVFILSRNRRNEKRPDWNPSLWLDRLKSDHSLLFFICIERQSWNEDNTFQYEQHLNDLQSRESSNRVVVVTFPEKNLGVGRKRTLAMILAEHLEIPNMFMLDDDIGALYEYEPSELNMVAVSEERLERPFKFLQRVIADSAFPTAEENIERRQKAVGNLGEFYRLLKKQFKSNEVSKDSINILNELMIKLSKASDTSKREAAKSPKSAEILKCSNTQVTQFIEEYLKSYTPEGEDNKFDKTWWDTQVSGWLKNALPRSRVGQVSLWNVRSAARRDYYNRLRTFNPGTHIVSSMRYQFVLFDVAACKGIHHITDKYLFEKPLESNERKLLLKKFPSPGINFKEPGCIELLHCGYKWDDAWIIRRLLLNGVSGFMVYRFGIECMAVRSLVGAQDTEESQSMSQLELSSF